MSRTRSQMDTDVCEESHRLVIWWLWHRAVFVVGLQLVNNAVYRCCTICRFVSSWTAMYGVSEPIMDAWKKLTLMERKSIVFCSWDATTLLQWLVVRILGCRPLAETDPSDPSDPSTDRPTFFFSIYILSSVYKAVIWSMFLYIFDSCWVLVCYPYCSYYGDSMIQFETRLVYIEA